MFSTGTKEKPSEHVLAGGVAEVEREVTGIVMLHNWPVASLAKVAH